ncbi:MAG: ArsR/SmtB family transcription factor [Candidatus Hodarchaeota archaeon]
MMDEEFKDDEKTKKPLENDDEELDLEESIRDMKREFRKQMQDIKDELSDIKQDYRSDFSKRQPQPPRPPRPPRKRRRDPSIDIETDNWEDWGEGFGSTLEHYIGGILDSIGETLDRSVGSIFQTYPSRRRRKGKRRREPYFIPEDELEDFYEKGSAIMGALSDRTRLRMLKELEKEPLRQSDLSNRIGTRGGNFKHHAEILKDEGLIRQEGVRERYLLTFAGREALKLVEFLYSRAKKRISVPVIISDDEDEEGKFSEEEEEKR